MSNEFGSQLVDLGLPPAMDAKTLAARALKRNRRRIRSLAALTIGLWAITFLLVPSMWMPFAAMMNQNALKLQAPDGHVLPVSNETLAKVLHDVTMYVAVISGYILGLMTIASLLAAISTVWLVLTVRRVTLEQVATGMAQISEQLAAMSRVSPSPSGKAQG
jgi:hypothetical protein